MGLSTPIMSSHQPDDGSAGEDAACAEGDKPVNSSTALSPPGDGSPQVSKAMRGDSMGPWSIEKAPSMAT